MGNVEPGSSRQARSRSHEDREEKAKQIQALQDARRALETAQSNWKKTAARLQTTISQTYAQASQHSRQVREQWDHVDATWQALTDTMHDVVSDDVPELVLKTSGIELSASSSASQEDGHDDRGGDEDKREKCREVLDAYPPRRTTDR